MRANSIEVRGAEYVAECVSEYVAECFAECVAEWESYLSAATKRRRETAVRY